MNSSPATWELCRSSSPPIEEATCSWTQWELVLQWSLRDECKRSVHCFSAAPPNSYICPATVPCLPSLARFTAVPAVCISGVFPVVFLHPLEAAGATKWAGRGRGMRSPYMEKSEAEGESFVFNGGLHPPLGASAASYLKTSTARSYQGRFGEKGQCSHLLYPHWDIWLLAHGIPLPK